MDLETGKNSFARNLAELLEIISFEQWLRFYFIDEDSEKEIFAIPAAILGRIDSFWPQLYPLAQALNGREVSFAVSQSAVCKLILERHGASDATELEDLLQSRELTKTLESFNAWLAREAKDLEKVAPDFADWQARFRQWQEQGEARGKF